MTGALVTTGDAAGSGVSGCRSARGRLSPRLGLGRLLRERCPRSGAALHLPCHSSGAAAGPAGQIGAGSPRDEAGDGWRQAGPAGAAGRLGTRQAPRRCPRVGLLCCSLPSPAEPARGCGVPAAISQRPRTFVRGSLVVPTGSSPGPLPRSPRSEGISRCAWCKSPGEGRCSGDAL